MATCQAPLPAPMIDREISTQVVKAMTELLRAQRSLLRWWSCVCVWWCDRFAELFSKRVTIEPGDMERICLQMPQINSAQMKSKSLAPLHMRRFGRLPVESANLIRSGIMLLVNVSYGDLCSMENPVNVFVRCHRCAHQMGALLSFPVYSTLLSDSFENQQGWTRTV